MKKTKKRVKKNSKKIKKTVKNKRVKKLKKTQKKIKKIRSKFKPIKIKAPKKIKKVLRKSKQKKENFILKIINFQNSLKPEINFKINFGFEKYIQAFFDKIANTIGQYKSLKKDESRRLKLEKIERARQEKIEIQNQKQKEEEIKVRLKEQTLKEEIKLEKQRAKDIKLFLRKEQALLRIEQAEKQKQFLKKLRLEKQIEKFRVREVKELDKLEKISLKEKREDYAGLQQRIEKFRVREVKELEKLEKVSLKEKREDYAGLQERIEKLKEKYRIIRDQKIRERVEALGVKIQGDEDRETLLFKEKEYTLARQKIEFALESFYRSASSLVFQLNKKHITRNMSIFRCIDRRFETGEIFIKWDESSDEEWLLLIYIKNNSPDEGIVIEDKTIPEKNISHEFKNNEIFKASDTMVDSLTQLISRKRTKN